MTVLWPLLLVWSLVVLVFAPAEVDAITNGTMAGAITQNPVGIGEQVVSAAVKAIKGETVPKVIDTGFYWYDKTNINDPKIQAVLYK